MHSKLDIFSHPFNDNIPNYQLQGPHDPRFLPLAQPQPEPPVAQQASASARRKQNSAELPKYPAYARAPVEHDTPIFGIADDVATCVLDESEDETYKAVNPRAPRIPRYLLPRDNPNPGHVVPSHGLISPVTSPSSRRVCAGPQPHPYTPDMHPAHAARAKWLAQYNDRKSGSPVEDGKTPRPQPTMLPEFNHQSLPYFLDQHPVYATPNHTHTYQTPYPSHYPPANPGVVYATPPGVHRHPQALHPHQTPQPLNYEPYGQSHSRPDRC